MVRNTMPTLRHHKPSGQAFVELNGKRFYLGVHGRAETQQRYLATVAEWLANGRELPGSPEEFTITELCLAYWRYAKQWYRRPDGRPTSTLGEIKLTLKALRRLYGSTTAATFGPKALRAIQSQFVRDGLSRSTVNSRTAVIKRAFKWAAGRELVAASAWHALQAVEGLRQGRSEAKEGKKVLPVEQRAVEATLPHLSPMVSTMVMLQWLTGMRPGEVCAMTPSDIDQREGVWVYRPAQHKNAHRGHRREVMAQVLLKPFLNRASDQPLFSPQESEQWHRQRRTLQRKTPTNQGNTVGSNRKNNPQRRPGTRYDANTYRRAIEPVYEYTMAQAMDDGYLAACEIVTADVSIDRDGLTIDQVMALNPKDARTGHPLTREQIEQQYFAANTFEKKLHLPDRVARMCGDLFEQLITRDGDPHQKTIIFCASDDHAAAVAAEMGNIYARWCLDHQVPPRPDYAFKCTAAANGNAQLPDFKGAVGSHYIATTVDLLTTGVDVPVCRNIVFFRYLDSPISFYQMVGRGTRLDLPSGKLLFRIYDYTNATRLFGEDFITKAPRSGRSAPRPPGRPRTIIRVDGISAVITPGQDQVLINLDGDARPVSIDDFKDRLTTSLLRQVPTIAGFRAAWCDRSDRAELLYHLPGGHKAALVLRELEFNELYDLYDVLARIGYETQPLTRPMRTGQFNFLNASWFAAMPSQAREKPPGQRRRGRRTIAKEALYRAILTQIRQIKPRFNIGITTGHNGGRECRWSDPYRHWSFRPNEHDYREERTKGWQKKNPT